MLKTHKKWIQKGWREKIVEERRKETMKEKIEWDVGRLNESKKCVKKSWAVLMWYVSSSRKKI